MFHIAYHLEAQRRQRVIERKHDALERLLAAKMVCPNCNLILSEIVHVNVKGGKVYFVQLLRTNTAELYVYFQFAIRAINSFSLPFIVFVVVLMRS